MDSRTRSGWATIVLDATLFMLAITNFKSRVVSSIISPWEGVKRGYMPMSVTMFLLLKVATI